jgi:hypothetical protein
MLRTLLEAERGGRMLPHVTLQQNRISVFDILTFRLFRCARKSSSECVMRFSETGVFAAGAAFLEILEPTQAYVQMRGF